jgi:amidase
VNRRRFLHRAIAALPAVRAVSAQPFDLEEATLADLDQGFRSGRLTSRAVTEWYLARIDALDKNGPRVNAVIELNPEAASIAEALDRERAAGGREGLCMAFRF